MINDVNTCFNTSGVQYGPVDCQKSLIYNHNETCYLFSTNKMQSRDIHMHCTLEMQLNVIVHPRTTVFIHIIFESKIQWGRPN